MHDGDTTMIAVVDKKHGQTAEVWSVLSLALVKEAAGRHFLALPPTVAADLAAAAAVVVAAADADYTVMDDTAGAGAAGADIKT